MRTKFFLCMALIAMVPQLIFAQEEGGGESTEPQPSDFYPIATGANFLIVAPDARGGGMGDVGGATTPDGDSQYWNPSKYAFINGVGGATISYVPWLRRITSDIDLVSVSGYYKIKEVQTIAASFRFFSIGNVLIKQTGAPEEGITVKPYDLAVDFSYSRILAKNFSMGIALRFIWSDLTGGYNPDGDYLQPGWAIAADISGYYGQKVPFAWGTGFGAFGFNISNIGSKINYGDYKSSAFLPCNLRLGGRFTMPCDEYNHITLNVDINKLLVISKPVRGYDEEGNPYETDEEFATRLDNYYKMDPITSLGLSFADQPDGSPYNFADQLKKLNFTLGLEYDYNEQFFGRFGYHYESKEMGNRQYVTFGAGFKLNVFSLDIAYVLSVVGPTNPLDQTLRFTLGFNMGGIKELAGATRDDSSKSQKAQEKKERKEQKAKEKQEKERLKQEKKAAKEAEKANKA